MNQPHLTTTATEKPAKPFIKWAGGKGQLLSQFADHYPGGLRDGSITRYVEPFVGGGAVFLDVLQRCETCQARLFDINPELILVYKVVQQQPHALIDLLSRHSDAYYDRDEEKRKELFYEMRDAYNAQLAQIDFDTFSDAWVRRAAYMIFLNKTCFNGLYRVNSKGKFNVPFGKYKRPTIVDAENIRNVSRYLQRAELFVGRFEESEPHITDRSFVYFDPPYRPLSTTSNFTSYSKYGFTDRDQIALAHYFAHLDRRGGAKLMLSNSNPKNVDPDDDFFEALYGNYNIHTVEANRMINSNASGRGKITELLITNY